MNDATRVTGKAVANALLREGVTLEKLHELRYFVEYYAKVGISRTLPDDMPPPSMTGNEVNRITGVIGSILTTPIGFDLFSVIVPSLIDAVKRAQ